MDITFPLSFDGRGRTAQAAGVSDHVRDLIEQVLFTAPGERVNRPTFGSGVMKLVFAPNGDALAATTQMSVQGALQQWLGELIVVEAVDVVNDDAKLMVTIQYTLRATGAREVRSFTQS